MEHERTRRKRSRLNPFHELYSCLHAVTDSTMTMTDVCWQDWRVLLRQWEQTHRLARFLRRGPMLYAMFEQLRICPHPVQDHVAEDIYVCGFVCKMFSQESTIRHTHRSVAAMFNVDTSSPHVSRPVQESEIDRVVVVAENSSSSSSGHLNVPFGWFWPCLLSLGRSCLFWRACGTSNVADQGGRICHRHKFRNDTSTKDSQPNCRCFILENVCGCLASSRSHDITDSTAYKAKQSLGPLGGTGW